jgi:hypothetical protein
MELVQVFISIQQIHRSTMPHYHDTSYVPRNSIPLVRTSLILTRRAERIVDVWAFQLRECISIRSPVRSPTDILKVVSPAEPSQTNVVTHPRSCKTWLSMVSFLCIVTLAVANGKLPSAPPTVARRIAAT